MRFGSSTATPTATYDSNTLSRAAGYTNVGLAPHGITQRFLYTVPAGKRAQLLSAHSMSMRLTVATTAATIDDWVSVFVNSISAFAAHTHWIDNTVGAMHLSQMGSGPMLAAGDQIYNTTSDASTAGTVDHMITCTYAEFYA